MSEDPAPAYLRCSRCGQQNHIVNECGCDPNNLPTKVPYQWGDEEYATRTACEDAIAAALASYLCDADAGVVLHGINAYCLKINVTLIE